MSGKTRIVLKETGQFKLIKQLRPGRKTWYEIEFCLRNVLWPVGASSWADRDALAAAVSQTFDPAGIKTFKKSAHWPQTNWRFWTLAEADQLFTLAVIKWSH